MDYFIAKKKKHSHTLMTRHACLTQFPSNFAASYSTPGFNGAIRKYNIVEPYTENHKSILANEKLVEPELRVNDGKHNHAKFSSSNTTRLIQEGYGSIEAHQSELKRKLGTDIFERMSHPIYQLTKIKKSKFDDDIQSNVDKLEASSSKAHLSEPTTSAASSSEVIKSEAKQTEGNEMSGGGVTYAMF
jgi:hypothetical protein